MSRQTRLYSGRGNPVGAVQRFVAMGHSRWLAYEQESHTQVPVTHPSTLEDLRVHITVNGNANPWEIRVRKNGIDADPSVTVPANTTGTFSSSSGSVELAAGDLVNYFIQALGFTDEIVVGNASITRKGSVSSWITASNRNYGFNVPSTTGFLYPTVSDNPITTESSRQLRVKMACALSRFSVSVSSNSRTSSTVYRVRKNSANGNSTVTVGAGATGIFTDAFNTDIFAVDDLVAYSITTGSGGESIFFPKMSADWTATNQAMMPFSRSENLEGSKFLVAGEIDSSSAVENQVQAPLKQRATVHTLHVRVQTNTRNGNSTLTVRKGGSGTDLAVTIASGTTGDFTNISDQVKFDPDDLLSLQLVRGGTTGDIGNVSGSYLVEQELGQHRMFMVF